MRRRSELPSLYTWVSSWPWQKLQYTAFKTGFKRAYNFHLQPSLWGLGNTGSLLWGTQYHRSGPGGGQGGHGALQADAFSASESPTLRGRVPLSLPRTRLTLPEAEISSPRWALPKLLISNGDNLFHSNRYLEQVSSFCKRYNGSL